SNFPSGEIANAEGASAPVMRPSSAPSAGLKKATPPSVAAAKNLPSGANASGQPVQGAMLHFSLSPSQTSKARKCIAANSFESGEKVNHVITPTSPFSV